MLLKSKHFNCDGLAFIKFNKFCLIQMLCLATSDNKGFHMLKNTILLASKG